MTSMWSALWNERRQVAKRRDEHQLRIFSRDSFTWVIRHKAYTPWYLVRYWRLLKFRIRNPHIVLRGMVFLGKDCEIHCRPGLGRMEIGRWVHIGDKTALRCHEGSLRIGDKAVFGKAVVVNTYLDTEIGANTLVADWTYICDFDHVTENIAVPIKDQGIVKGPVRIGPDCWLATKVTITRNTYIGRGCVLGANAVARGTIPDYSIAVGVPAKVVKNRKDEWEKSAQERAQHAADLADIEREKQQSS